MQALTVERPTVTSSGGIRLRTTFRLSIITSVVATAFNSTRGITTAHTDAARP